MSDALLRVSELAAVETGDVSLVGDGSARLTATRVGLSERDALRSGIRTRAGDREHDARDRAQAGRYGRRRRCQRPQLLDDQAGGRSGRGRRYDVRLQQRGDPAARWAIGSCGPELAATTTGDIGREKDGSGRLAIRRSNTDQEGEGAGCYLPPATMTPLDQRLAAVTAAWTAEGRYEGPAFRRVTRSGAVSGHAPLTPNAVWAIAGRWKDPGWWWRYAKGP